MTRTLQPRFLGKILAVSLASIGAPAMAADGDDEVLRYTTPENEVEAGIGYVSDSSPKFGEYTGLHREGTYFLGNIDMTRRDKQTGNYVELYGRDLGLDSRSLQVRGGQQGNYGLRLEYSELPKFWSDTYQTPFVNPGSTNVTLPPGFVRSATTAGMTTLNASMHNFDIDSKRKALTLGAGKILPNGWDADVRVKHETRDGNRLIGAVIGNTGGNPRAAILPEPIDYTTDEVEALVRYADKKMQLQFGYFGSFFSNANSALSWANPFASSVWVSPATPGVTTYNNGQLALPPDNQFHQFSASGGYTLTPDTRLSGSLSFGRGKQDDAFLPYTVNPALAATVAVPLPRTSLDGKVDTMHADLKLHTKVMPKMTLTAAYRYDDRDNNTPQAIYRYIGGDSQGQLGAGLDHIRTNLPVSSTRQVFDADLDYQYSPATKFKVGYAYDWAKKTFEAIEKEQEHSFKGEVVQHFGETMYGGLKYTYSTRTISDFYNAGAPFVASYSPLYIATLTPGLVWDNVPNQYKFFLAPRDRNQLRAFFNSSPTEAVDLQFWLEYKDDDYHDSQYGLQKARGWTVNADAGMKFNDAMSGHAFVSYDRYDTDQRSIALGAAQTNVTNTGLDWTAAIRDHTFTFGAGLRYKPLRQYEVGGDLVYAKSSASTDVATGPAIAAAQQATPLPDLSTRLTRLDLYGKYYVKKDVAIKLRYIYEHYSSSDWALDQVLSNTLANVIGTNQQSPNYNVHFIGVSLAYQF